MDLLPIRRAILSVTDKSGLAEFAGFLAENGVELVSTGGTMKALQAAGLPVKQVSDVTGFPEILGGRVKTLHPKIHGGILCNKDLPEHLETLKQMDIVPVDLVCVNLYNFAGAARLPCRAWQKGRACRENGSVQAPAAALFPPPCRLVIGLNGAGCQGRSEPEPWQAPGQTPGQAAGPGRRLGRVRP